MDLLENKGEVSPEDIAVMEAMSKEELVELVVGLNHSWYQVLESLEQAHTQDLELLSKRMSEKLAGGLTSIALPEKAALSGLKALLLTSEKRLADGQGNLNSLKTMLGKYMSSISTGGASRV